jgi:hypothetical protein
MDRVDDWPLFHWSPTPARASIKRRGLVPGRLSLDRLWRPPYICFADSPSLAWSLSARIHPEIPQWDLWYCWRQVVSYERLGGRGQDHDEYRVYERVYKADLWFVGTRSQEDGR